MPSVLLAVGYPTTTLHKDLESGSRLEKPIGPQFTHTARKADGGQSGQLSRERIVGGLVLGFHDIASIVCGPFQMTLPWVQPKLAAACTQLPIYIPLPYFPGPMLLSEQQISRLSQVSVRRELNQTPTFYH